MFRMLLSGRVRVRVLVLVPALSCNPGHWVHRL